MIEKMLTAIFKCVRISTLLHPSSDDSNMTKGRGEENNYVGDRQNTGLLRSST